MEERVHPIPFRTRKLSSPSPMILHNVMWESRPLPTSFKAPRCYSRGELCYFTPRLFLRSAVLIRKALEALTAKATSCGIAAVLIRKALSALTAEAK